MPESLLDIVPGYAEAVAKESFLRDAAFLPVTETVAGFELRPMTLADYLALRATGNPLLRGQIPNLAQLSAFLWRLSPVYNLEHKGRREFYRKLARLVSMPRNWALWNTRRSRAAYWVKVQRKSEALAQLLQAIRWYMEQTFADAPLPSATRGFDPDYYSDGAALCAKFAERFGWEEQTTLALPLTRLFQYLKWMRALSGEPLANPSDALKARWLASMNRN